MKLNDLEAGYLEAQGRYATEVQRFGHSARPDFRRLVEAGSEMNAARRKWLEVKRDKVD